MKVLLIALMVLKMGVAVKSGVLSHNILIKNTLFKPKTSLKFVHGHRFTMKNALIIHGTEGYPQENWFPWLKEKLEKQGYEVFVPQFPTPKNQDPEHWFETIEDLMPLFNEETIIVGHSCGGTFLLKILEQLKIRINVAVIVASSVGIPPVKYEHVDAPFLKTPLDWEKIRAATRHSIVFHSEDDPYICIENGIEIAEKFGTELQRSVDAGHFNEKAGFTTFEELWGKLRPFL